MIFTGRVQGVGFRYKARYVADHYGLTGYVKNEYDGSVLVEVQGTELDIQMFLQNLYQDRYIDIDNLEKREIPVIEEENAFYIE
jgi:acylphosphatase